MFTRLLIRLRWPLAAVVALTLIAMTCTVWRSFHATINVKALGIHPFGSLQDGALRVVWSRNYVDGMPWVWSDRAYAADIKGNVARQGRWMWWFLVEDSGYHAGFDVPLWAVALPPTALAFAGFRAKRRQNIPGLCRTCRYPLKNATICPECGRAAPSN